MSIEWQRILHIGVGFCLGLLIAVGGGSLTWAQPALPVVPMELPQPPVPVLDLADQLTSNQEAQLAQHLNKLEQDTGWKLRVLRTKSTGSTEWAQLHLLPCPSGSTFRPWHSFKIPANSETVDGVWIGKGSPGSDSKVASEWGEDIGESEAEIKQKQRLKRENLSKPAQLWGYPTLPQSTASKNLSLER